MSTRSKRPPGKRDGRAGRRNGEWKGCVWPGCNRRAIRWHLCSRDHKRATVTSGKMPDDWPSQSKPAPDASMVQVVVDAWESRHQAPVLELHRGGNAPSTSDAPTTDEPTTRLGWLVRQLDEARRARQMAAEAETWTSVSGLMREERALHAELVAERDRLAETAAADSSTLADLPRDQYLAKLGEHADTLDVEALEVYVRAWLSKTGHELGNEAGRMVIRRATA